MKAVWTILLILFLIILFLMLDILFYRPKVQTSGSIEETDHTEEIPLLSSDRYEEAARDILRSLHYVWPRLYQFLHIEQTDHLLMIQYISSSKDHPFIYLTSDIHQLHAFFNAADTLMKELVIYRSFILAIPLSRRFEKQAVSELEQWLTDHSIIPSFILQKGGGNRKLTSSDTEQACIITTKAGVKEIHLVGDQQEAFLQHLLTLTLPIETNQSNIHLIQDFKHTIPWQIQLETRIPFLQKKAVKDFLTISPACAIAFHPVIIPKHNRLCLEYATDLKETLFVLQSEAAKYHMHIQLSDIHKPYQSTSGYSTIKKAIEQTDNALTVIPFISDNDDLFILKDEQIPAYTPEGRTVSISFYKNLLSKSRQTNQKVQPDR